VYEPSDPGKIAFSTPMHGPHYWRSHGPSLLLGSRNKFWTGAQMTAGEPEMGKPFEVHVPPDVKEIMPNATVVNRSAIMVRGHLREACGKLYLVAVFANPLGHRRFGVEAGSRGLRQAAGEQPVAAFAVNPKWWAVQGLNL
jgi:hypothetical protein